MSKAYRAYEPDQLFLMPPTSYNVSPNNAVAFGAINDQFSRGKSNGATTIILYQMMERRCWA